MLASPASAHIAGTARGFDTGFTHPLLGPNHLVAVGFWGGQLGNPALSLLPVALPLVMAVGGMIDIAGLIIRHPEQMIAVSGLALGLMVAFRLLIPFGPFAH